MVRLNTYAFVDPGTRLTAIRFWIPEYNKQHETVIVEKNWEQMISKIVKLLESWGTKIMVLEYNPEYREPIRQQGSWGQKDFKGLLEIITKIRNWASGNKVIGYSIYPKEIIDERVRGNYCWRHYWEPKDDDKLYYCSAHKKDCGLTRGENISEYDKQIRHRDEVDCKIIQKVFQTKIEVSDVLLSKRKKLFEMPWKLLGSYNDNSDRNTRLKKDGEKQKKEETKTLKGFMF